MQVKIISSNLMSYSESRLSKMLHVEKIIFSFKFIFCRLCYQTLQFYVLLYMRRLVE